MGTHYLLALKDSWPTLADDVGLFFDRELATAFDIRQTVDGDHGRIETRGHFVSHDVAPRSTDRRSSGEPRFPDLASLVR